MQEFQIFRSLADRDGHWLCVGDIPEFLCERTLKYRRSLSLNIRKSNVPLAENYLLDH